MIVIIIAQSFFLELIHFARPKARNTFSVTIVIGEGIDLFKFEKCSWRFGVTL